MLHGLPDHPAVRFVGVGQCIYCGATGKLSDEHIVPLALGGRWVLPAASCSDCAETTSLFEQTVLRPILGALRIHYGFPTRRKAKRPQTLPLKVRRNPENEWTQVQYPADKYPYLVMMPLYDMPAAFSGLPAPPPEGPASRRFWIRGGNLQGDASVRSAQICDELGVAEVEPTGQIHTPEFCRLIAKVAHAFAVATLGVGGFTPCLLKAIRFGDLSDRSQHIGGWPGVFAPTAELHDVTMLEGYDPNIVGVYVRLLSCLDAPPYFVVAGRLR